MSEANKLLVQRATEAYNTGDLTAVREYFSPDLIDHNPPPIAGVTFASGFEGWTQVQSGFLRAFPDLQFPIVDIVAEGDKVVVRSQVTGTHLGDFFGIPATGNAVDYQAIVIWGITDGRITDRWATFDNVRLLTQLGLMPSIDANTPLGRATYWTIIHRATVGRAVAVAAGAGLLLAGLRKARATDE